MNYRPIDRPTGRPFPPPNATHRFCRRCTERRIKEYLYFPNLRPPPFLAPLATEFCRFCGRADVITNHDLAWANIHGGGSTGLPFGFAIIIREDDKDTTFETYQEMWGVPYLDLIDCPSCGLRAWVSEFYGILRLLCAHCRSSSQYDFSEDYFARERRAEERRRQREIERAERLAEEQSASDSTSQSESNEED